MLKKIRILWTYLRTKNRKFTNRESLIKYQDRQLLKFVRTLSKKSSYYRDLTVKTIKTTPVITKDVMLKNFNAMNTAKLDLDTCFQLAEEGEKKRSFGETYKGLSVGLSSGTSGTRGLFVSDETEQAKWAGVILAKGMDQPIWRSLKVALFLRANNNLYETIGASKHIKFKYFDLMKSFEEHLPVLESFQPNILVAPPTVLRCLSEQMKANRMSLSPRKVFSVAETLDDIDKVFIEEQFQQKVHQIYQCTEGFIAVTCKQGTIHLNEDQMVIEKKWLTNDKTKFSPIITDFNRVTQPIVRYLLDDILTVKKSPCSCGSVLTAIEKIEGRCGDILYFRSKETGALEPVFPDVMSRLILLADPEVTDYQITQLTPDSLSVYLQSENVRADIDFFEKLQDLCALQRLQMPHIERVQSFERGAVAFKRRRIRSEIAKVRDSAEYCVG